MNIAEIYIGLGSNKGDSIKNIKDAINCIYYLFGRNNCKQSKLYITSPVDADGPDFVNAAMKIYSYLSPLDLLKETQEIEKKFRRTRPYKNAPRTLDIDILLYGKKIIQYPELMIPHPRMHERLFVLKPLQDLKTNLEIPIYGKINQIIKNISDQKISLINS